jgi:NAD(P)-dependent dehydrogenase (short-subunit alcohol dehydrogenase family)
LGRKSIVAPTDITRPEEVSQLVDVVLQKYGNIDILKTAPV